jgi:hypothetical protein
MKKFLVGLVALATMAMLIGNVYAQAPVNYVPVKYVNKPIPVKTVTWTWTYTCPYPCVVVPVTTVAYVPIVAVCPPPEPPCLGKLRRVLTCPFKVVDDILSQ